jgi:hypothetical protein
MNIQVQDSRYLTFTQAIQAHFHGAEDSIHKARNEIKIIPFEDESFVVKSFKIPNLFNKLVYTFFRDSKAKKSYENSIKIAPFAPRAIGYIEFKKFGLLDESYFVSENFVYDYTIRKVLHDLTFANRDAFFKSFAAFTYELHEKEIYHLDYSPGNILVQEREGAYIFKIVDINRMQFRPLDLTTRMKNFAQLWAKDEDLTQIVTEYAKLIHADAEECVKQALKYSQAHKDKKNFKKKLRGQKV